MTRLALTGFVGALASVVLLHCDKADPLPANDAGSGEPGPPSAVLDAAATADADADGIAPAADAAVPDLRCTSEDASVCDTLPSTVCADDATVVYFSDGTCVDGKCMWTQGVVRCSINQGSRCEQGACTPLSTIN